ncbi:unnamed protein product [Protopolystoma xenopodis]|uniref:Uncharacterized protein n=1 Tax=Protopolystoma xenopodis TaxID=117903 RepID=A0A3S4ZMB7_9PLAT|nr:unnamed protein product [Protopolystoma xenopodis]
MMPAKHLRTYHVHGPTLELMIHTMDSVLDPFQIQMAMTSPINTKKASYSKEFPFLAILLPLLALFFLLVIALCVVSLCYKARERKLRRRQPQRSVQDDYIGAYASYEMDTVSSPNRGYGLYTDPLREYADVAENYQRKSRLSASFACRVRRFLPSFIFSWLNRLFKLHSPISQTVRQGNFALPRDPGPFSVDLLGDGRVCISDAGANSLEELIFFLTLINLPIISRREACPACLNALSPNSVTGISKQNNDISGGNNVSSKSSSGEDNGHHSPIAHPISMLSGPPGGDTPILSFGSPLGCNNINDVAVNPCQFTCHSCGQISTGQPPGDWLMSNVGIYSYLLAFYN